MTTLAGRVRRITSDRLALAVTVVAVLTIVAGISQLILPGVALGILDAEVTTTSKHFFAIVGMFMAVVGGAVLHAMLDDEDHPIIIFWGGVQKLGAVAGVLVGVMLGVFSSLALGVVAFDAASTVVMFLYWWRIR